MSFIGVFGTIEITYHAATVWFEGVIDLDRFTASLIEDGDVRVVGEGPTEAQALQDLYQEYAKIIAAQDIKRFID